MSLLTTRRNLSNCSLVHLTDLVWAWIPAIFSFTTVCILLKSSIVKPDVVISSVLRKFVFVLYTPLP